MSYSTSLTHGDATFMNLTYTAKEKLIRLTKSATNLHRPDGSPNVFVFARPRGGSTWLTELILSQPTFKAIDEPLNLRHKRIRDELGLRHLGSVLR